MAITGNQNKIEKIAIAAAGTGGHVYPAISVAKGLLKKGIKLHWIGTKTGIEARLVGKSKLPYSVIHMKGIRGKGLARWFLMPFILLGAFLEARKILKQSKAQVLMAFGGYVTVPAGLAAKTLGIPIYVMEQNAAAGLSNKILSRFAKKIFCGFDCEFKGDKACVVGNPVRPEIFAIPDMKPIVNRPLRIFVLGGSLGAKALNEIVPDAVHIADGNFEVFHQTGEKTFEIACRKYEKHGMFKTVRVEQYIDKIADQYAWCDLIICRAGALTVSEVAAAGRPAIFVPLPGAVDDHQRKNAAYLTKQNAGKLIDQSDLTPESLARLLNELYKDPDKLIQMGKKARSLSKPGAVGLICDAVV